MQPRLHVPDAAVKDKPYFVTPDPGLCRIGWSEVFNSLFSKTRPSSLSESITWHGKLVIASIKLLSTRHSRTSRISMITGPPISLFGPGIAHAINGSDTFKTHSGTP